MQYRHWLTLWKPSPDAQPGTQNSDVGTWTPNPAAPDLTLYDGAADVQEAPKRSIKKDSGETSVTADAVAYLADEWVLTGRNGIISVTEGSDGQVTTQDGTNQTIVAAGPVMEVDRDTMARILWEDGSVTNAKVVGVRRLDGAVMLRHV